LKLKYDEPLSNFGFNFNLRRFTLVQCAARVAAAAARVAKLGMAGSIVPATSCYNLVC